MELCPNRNTAIATKSCAYVLAGIYMLKKFREKEVNYNKMLYA